MGRLGAIGAGLVCATAFAQTATFTPLRGNAPPFPVVGGNWSTLDEYPRMSGDGSTVSDGRWRWTRSGGVVPAGFVPGSNQSSDVRRRPLGLSFDGRTEFGAIFSASTGQSQSMYWESVGRFDSLPYAQYNYNWAFLPSQTLSDDGNWIFYTQTQPQRVRYRLQRGGTPEPMPGGPLDSVLWSPSFSGDACLIADGVLRIPPNKPLADAVLHAQPAGFYPYAMSSDAKIVAGVGTPVSEVGAIWNTETDAVDRFAVPLGFRTVGGPYFVSDTGGLIVGSATGFQPGSRRLFVRRSGEQARELRIVLGRFGDTSSNYYVLVEAGGLSRDGKTLLVVYSSPLWYGDGAAIVTLPDWEPCPADMNFDGFVDDADFSIFAGAYDRLTTTDGDLNVDQFTDDADFSLFAVAYDALLCP